MPTRPALAESLAEGYNWTELEQPVPRTYYYPDGSTFDIPDDIQFIAVRPSGSGHSHRLVTTDGTSYYVAAGFIAISWPQAYQF